MGLLASGGGWAGAAAGFCSPHAKDVQVLAFSARDGGALRALADHSVIIPTERTDRAQELHLCIEHIICDMIDQTL